jgi:hypothetical protein
LGGEVKRLEVLLFYDYQNGITNEWPKLFSLGIINLPETIQSVKTTNVGIMDTNVKINILEQGFEVQSVRNYYTPST